jgi:protein SCO1
VKLLAIIGLSLLLAPAAFADSPFFRGEVQQPVPEKGLPKAVKNVGIDQHLGDQVSLDLPMRDENGKWTTLGAYFGKRPVILVMAYYQCPNLCTMVMNGVFSSMKALPFTAGKDFDVVSVSINPIETSEMARKKRDAYVGGYHQQDNINGYHFLTTDQHSIDVLTKQVGFNYAYDTASGQYAHASGIMMLTPEGKLSRYFYGVEYRPEDMKYGLMDASGNKIGTLADKVLLFCYHYDPSASKYSLAVINLLKIGGVLTLLAMAGMFYSFRRRNHRALSTTVGIMTVEEHA